jgi:hypothetical protein
MRPCRCSSAPIRCIIRLRSSTRSARVLTRSRTASSSSSLGTGRWTAERRDTHETLRDQTPLGLRDQIIADYTARKVSRNLPGQPG